MQATLEGCPHLNPEKLKEHGFDAEMIERIEGLTASAFDLSMVFNQFTFGDQYLIDKLGIPRRRLIALTSTSLPVRFDEEADCRG